MRIRFFTLLFLFFHLIAPAQNHHTPSFVFSVTANEYPVIKAGDPRFFTPLANGINPDQKSIFTGRQVTYSVNPNPVCEGESIKLTASGAVHYQWVSPGGDTYEGAEVNIPVASYREDGFFTLTATDQDGIVTVLSPKVTVFPKPVINLFPDTLMYLCKGNEVEIGVSGAETYLWSTQDTSSQITVTMGGRYIVTVTDEYGCTASGSVLVNSIDSVEVSLTAPDTICDDDHFILTPGDNFFSYIWGNGTTTKGIPITTSGLYSVTVYDQHGCQGFASKEVTVLEGRYPWSTTLPDSVFSNANSFVNIIPEQGWTYSWQIENGEILSGQGTTSVRVKWGEQGTGILRLITVNQGLCPDTLTWEVTIIKNIATNDINNLSEPLFYPNPTSGILYTTEAVPANSRLALYDMTGRLMWSGNPAKATVDISNFPSGMYLMRIKDKSSTNPDIITLITKI